MPTASMAFEEEEPVPDFNGMEVMTFEEFERRVTKIPGKLERYIVNGDVQIIGRRNLEAYFRLMQRQLRGIAGGKLLVNRLGSGPAFAGRADVWDSVRRKSLVYCVSSEFNSQHAAVVAALEAATGEWERQADVNFSYKASEDGRCAPDNPAIVFAVAPMEMSRLVAAIAPFPHFQQRDRVLGINPRILPIPPQKAFDLTGLMRHELGHVLGFDHEQSRPEAGTCFVADDSFAATPYDPRSVMHYPDCAALAVFAGFALSELDKSGVACVYGPGPDSDPNDRCPYRAAISAVTGREVTVELSVQRVEAGKWQYYGPYAAAYGSIATIDLQRDREAGGDPDLYIRYVDRPNRTESMCNPRLDAESEQCRVQIPNGRKHLHVGVYGERASTYNLTITYTAQETGT